MKNQTLVVLYEVSELGSLKTLMTFHIGVKISMDFSHHLRCVCVCACMCVRGCLFVCVTLLFLYLETDLNSESFFLMIQGHQYDINL